MSLTVVGQRCMSEREPELGLGLVASVDPAARRIAIDFPAANEKRLYALGTPVLKRAQFRVGDPIATRDGVAFTIATVEEENGLLVYAGEGRRAREDAISDVTSVSLPQERLLAGQVDPGDVFNLRYRTLQAQAQFRQSPVRGFLGGRVELIPHQFYILHEMSARQIPRVLLADEVGLGKTIEACLIVQRLLAVGRARRVLILVPETLIHQWFVELLRRFNLWFSIYDEERCAALEASDPGDNPFLATQLALSCVELLAGSETRQQQAVAAGWDIVVVDEAHHLEWTPEEASPEYTLVEQLARKSPGLLLLTATPMQLGMGGHYARLRLLDPNRYASFERFLEESARFETVAHIADKIVEAKRLTRADAAALQAIFNRDPERLAQHLAALAHDDPGARTALLRTLLDQHGTGRVMFRNTRAAMTGFPKRQFCPAPVDADGNAALIARVARELPAEERGDAAALRYSFKEDPRIEWLVGLLKQHRAAKILLICKTQRKAAAIEAALQERMRAKSALFHEGLALVQRDRNAAWFAEPDGAQLLICSEIGSEGRNFQFAHHLVLFDLPLNPGLLEQRIGRLDRIGQTQTIRIHVPYVAGSAEEGVVEWYHRGLDAFESPLPGGEEYEQQFKERLLAIATRLDRLAEDGSPFLEKPEFRAFIAETKAFREKVARRLREGRDRLLELNSFDRGEAARVIQQIRAADADRFPREFLLTLLDHFGVRLKEHEEGDVFLDPSHAYIEGFPSIPAEGMLVTFDRRRAINREDIRFVSADHPLMQDAIDLLVEGKSGTTAFGLLRADEANLLIEAVFVLEAVADTRWHVDQFLAPTPVRVVVDLRGNDRTPDYDARVLAEDVNDADIHRFLERPEFNAGVLKPMLEAANERATEAAARLTAAARTSAETALAADLQRLKDLRRINDHVREEEVALAAEQLRRTSEAISQARLRLDALRLIVTHPPER